MHPSAPNPLPKSGGEQTLCGSMSKGYGHYVYGSARGMSWAINAGGISELFCCQACYVIRRDEVATEKTLCYFCLSYKGGSKAFCTLACSDAYTKQRVEISGYYENSKLVSIEGFTVAENAMRMYPNTPPNQRPDPKAIQAIYQPGSFANMFNNNGTPIPAVPADAKQDVKSFFEAHRVAVKDAGDQKGRHFYTDLIRCKICKGLLPPGEEADLVAHHQTHANVGYLGQTMLDLADETKQHLDNLNKGFDERLDAAIQAKLIELGVVDMLEI